MVGLSSLLSQTWVATVLETDLNNQDINNHTSVATGSSDVSIWHKLIARVSHRNV